MKRPRKNPAILSKDELKAFNARYKEIQETRKSPTRRRLEFGGQIRNAKTSYQV